MSESHAKQLVDAGEFGPTANCRNGACASGGDAGGHINASSMPGDYPERPALQAPRGWRSVLLAARKHGMTWAVPMGLHDRAAGTLIDVDNKTERRMRYDVWNDGHRISGRLYLPEGEQEVGFDWFDYVGREVVLILADERKLNLSVVQAREGQPELRIYMTSRETIEPGDLQWSQVMKDGRDVGELSDQKKKEFEAKGWVGTITPKTLDVCAPH